MSIWLPAMSFVADRGPTKMSSRQVKLAETVDDLRSDAGRACRRVSLAARPPVLLVHSADTTVSAITTEMSETTMLESTSTIIASVAAIIASGVAVHGINAWRREYVGRRRIDLAEEILALFYEARNVVSWIRSPVALQGEGSTRESSPEETPEEKEARDAAFVLIERYQKRQELFARIHSLRYRFMAQNGRDSGKPFKDLRAVRVKLFRSSRQLARLWRQQQQPTLSHEQYRRLTKQMEEAQSVFWEYEVEPDPIAPEVDRIVDCIETTCRGILGA